MSSIFNSNSVIAASQRLPLLAGLIVFCLSLVRPASAQGEPPIDPPIVYTSTNIIHFESAVYFATENSLQALITVVREGPLTNFVSVGYNMVDGTAITGIHYQRNRGRAFFFPEEDRAQFIVPLIDDFNALGDVFLNLVLENPLGSAETFAMLGEPDTAILNIRDDESIVFGNEAGVVELAAGNGPGGAYIGTQEEWNIDDNDPEPVAQIGRPFGPPGIMFTVVRLGGSRGRIEVDWETTTDVIPISTRFTNYAGFPSGGVAVPGEDFIPASGTLILDDYQMSAKGVVSLPIQNTFELSNTFFTNRAIAPLTAGVRITAVRPAEGELPEIQPELGSFTQRNVVIVDNTKGFGFSRKHYWVSEGERFVRIRVKRSEVTSDTDPFGAVHVHYVINNRLIAENARGGDHQGNLFALEPGSDYATPYQDYEPPGSLVWENTVITEDPPLHEIPGGRGWVQDPQSATIEWDANEVTDRYILIPIIDDDEAEFNEDMRVQLWKHLPDETDGFVNALAGNCIVTIWDNDQPAGASEVDFNPDNNRLTDPPYMTTPGANNTVQSVAVQPDGKVILGGDFSAVNMVNRVGIARLNFDGSTDHSFNPGNGVSGFVRTVLLQPDGKILIGGLFDAVNGVPNFSLARLNNNGSVDTSFHAGLGADGPVRTMALQSDGKIVIGGEFLSVGGTNRNYIARLNQNGTLDTSFDPGFGPSGPVNSIAIADGVPGNSPVDERIVIGGDFTEYDGTAINYIARLNPNGSIDPSFNPGTGADNIVYSVVKQGTQIIMAGDFDLVDLRPRNGVARLNEDGSLDLNFEPGTGFDDSVYSVILQPNGLPILGGLFTEFNQTRRVGLARLNRNGTLDTSFMDTAKNQFAGIPNVFAEENAQSMENFIRSMAYYRTTNITLITNIIVDPEGVTNIVVTPELSHTEHIFAGGRFERFGGGFGRDDIRSRLNIARVLGGSTFGPGNIGFTQSFYSVDENAGSTFITLVRTNGAVAPISVEFNTQDRPPGGPGLAISGSDYVSETYNPLWVRSHDEDRQFADAYMGPNNNTFSPHRGRGNLQGAVGIRFAQFADDNIFISVLDDNNIEGDEVLDLKLSNPDQGRLILGGEPIPVGTALGKPDAQLIIVDNDFHFGTLGFSHVEYFVNESENEGQTFVDAFITVTREGGATGPVSVDVYVENGTATTADYFSFSRRTLFFGNGQTTNRFSVRIRNDTVAELEETLRLVLTNPSGFPLNVAPELRLDPARATATLYIIDDDFAYGRLSFIQSQFDVDETGGKVRVSVARRGGNLGEVFVNFATADGTAIAGMDYVSTNGVLHWVSGNTDVKTFEVQLLDNFDVNENKTFQVILSDPSIPLALGAQPTATVNIINDDAPGTFVFSQPEYAVDENGPYANITILRQSGISGRVEIDFSVTDLTAVGTNVAMTFAPTGLPDYVYPTNTHLVFNQNESSKTFRVGIIDDSIVEGEKRIALAITNVTGGGIIGAVRESVITIIDNELNRIPAGSVDTTFLATGTDNFIYSLELESQGKIILGGDFKYVNDVLRDRLARLNPNGTLDPSFDPIPGPNNTVRALDLEPNGRLVIGGLFNTVGITNRSRLARLNSDSTVDTTFDPGAGTDNAVFSLVEQPDGRIVFVGDFSTYRGVPRRSIARASTNGTVDVSFNPGTGPNGTLYTVALQSDGKILIGGDFTTYNEIPRTNIARLNRDGSLDTTFTASANASVRAILVQPDNSIVIGGLFSAVNGQPNYNNIARLLPATGALDPEFNFGNGSVRGADGPVNVLALQIDGKILVGGDFTRFNGRTRNRLTRLNMDGSVDPTINFGSGFNGSVSSIIVQPDRNIVVAGGFSEYNGIPARNLVRIHGGAIAGPGSIQFSSPFYTVSEGERNAIITLRRTGGTEGRVSVDFRTIADTAGPGDYVSISTNIVFEEAETFRSILIPITPNTAVGPDLFVNLALSNVTGGATLGPQPNARLTILNDDMEIQFSSAAYSVSENFVAGTASVTLQRTGSTASAASVLFYTAPGLPNPASPALDYITVSNVVQFEIGQRSRTFAITVLDDSLVEGNENVRLVLTNLVVAGTNAQGRLGPLSESVLTIVDDDRAAGRLRFAAPQFSGSEGSGQIIVTVERIEGASGVVSVDYRTTAGPDPTATAPSDYSNVSGILSFADGVVEKSFTIPVFQDAEVEGNENITVILSNPRGGATIAGSAEGLAIVVDDDLAPGSLDGEFNPSPNAPVRVVKLASDQDIYIGGEFTRVNSVNRSYVARLNPTGSVDTGFDPFTGPNAPVSDIELESGESLLISGDFNTVRGVLNNRVARLSTNGEWLPTFNLPFGLNAEVIDIAQRPNGRVIIGGRFDKASAAGRNRIAQLMPDGTVDTEFNPGEGADSTVYAVALQSDGKVLIGGSFSSINGSLRRGIARLNQNGSLDTSFSSGFGFDGAVHDIMVLEDGMILVAGDFTSFNGVPRRRVALLNPQGTLSSSFVPGSGPGAQTGFGPNGAVYALARQSDGKFLIGGDFTTVTTATATFPRNRLARLNADGSLDATFTPGDGANGAVLSIAVQPQDGRVIVAGRFTTFDRIPRSYIARLNNDESFRPVETELRLTIDNDPLMGGQIRITFASLAGAEYVLQGSTDLNAWTEVQRITGTADSTTVHQPTGLSYRFYRVIRP